jgi:hypothetical protein
MPAMHVTPLYAALLGLVFFVLSVRTIGLRRRVRVAIGDGGDAELLRAMRVHANFAEYVPLALLLLMMFEWQGGPALLVHALGLALLAGRLSHALGVSRAREEFKYRVFGMSMTFTAIVGAALGLLALYALRLVH